MLSVIGKARVYIHSSPTNTETVLKIANVSLTSSKKSVSYFIDLLHGGNKIAPPFFPKSFLFLCLTSKAKREHSKTNRDFLPFFFLRLATGFSRAFSKHDAYIGYSSQFHVLPYSYLKLIQIITSFIQA